MGTAANRVSLVASGRSQIIDGSICITAGEAISAVLLPPVIAALRDTHPGIQVELVASNATRDLRKREADIAIRNFRPQHPELVARKIKEVPAHLYASPRYLESLAPLRSADDLTRADFVGFDSSHALLHFLNGKGLALTEANFSILTENHLVQWELVKEGLGIGVMQEDIGDGEPKVVRVPVEIEPFDVPMWLTAHRELHTSRRVRVVFDFLYEYLRGNADSE
jgi:DNA-binding transcriptional LysR family regulator